MWSGFIADALDMTAEQRTVLTARAYEDITVIQNGLNPGERVIVYPPDALVDGARVKMPAAE
mgnify:CR=1 FL=1